MNNYKELISALREEAEAVKAVEWDIPICTSNHIAEAANVIEQDNEIIASLQRELVETAKERDQWITLGHLANKRAEDYREMRRQRDEAIKERDAAIADLRKTASCLVCKHFGENGITCDALNQCLYGEHDVWEWRGVQEAEHGND